MAKNKLDGFSARNWFFLENLALWAYLWLSLSGLVLSVIRVFSCYFVRLFGVAT
jgi:hypothetical protein